jgi:P-type conjugative transfer protein TrbL
MIFAGALFLALPQPAICEAADSSILEEIYGTLEEYQGEWLKKMGGLIWWSFMGLLSISFTWQVSQMALSETFSFGSMIGLMVRTGMYAGFFKWIFENPQYVTVIPDSFMKLSEMVTGYKVEIFNLLNISGQMLDTLGKAAQALSWYMAIVGSLAIITVNAMLYAIVGVILMLKIEVVMVSLAGFSLLVFCGLSHMMSDYALTYTKALIGCGLKLFMCGIIGGMLQDFCGRFITMLSADSTGFMTVVGVMIGMLVVLWIIVSNIPNYVHAIFYGVPAGSAGAAWSGAVTYASLIGASANIAKETAKAAALVPTGAAWQLYKGFAGEGKNVATGNTVGNTVTLSNNQSGSSNSGAPRQDADGSS